MILKFGGNLRTMLGPYKYSSPCTSPHHDHSDAACLRYILRKQVITKPHLEKCHLNDTGTTRHTQSLWGHFLFEVMGQGQRKQP